MNRSVTAVAPRSTHAAYLSCPAAPSAPTPVPACVLGAEGTLIGVVSLDDLLILFARQIDSLANAVAAETVKHG